MAPKDYKERPARSKARTKAARPAKVARRPAAGSGANVVRWRWFGVGICVGAVATAALFLYEPSVARQVAGGPAKTDKGVDEPPRTRFEFYTLLTEKEMVVPEPEIDTQPPPAKAPATVKAVDKPALAGAAPTSTATPVRGRYLLQVGSFRSAEDADSVKAKLAFLGLEGSIQTISIDGKETWHRVRVGPYSNRAQLDEARGVLKDNKYDVLVLKLKDQ